MKIIIVGAGLVGLSLAEHLIRMDHDITLVESDRGKCDRIGEKLDILTVNGSGSNPRDLEQAGIEGADMLLAVTPIDEINITACMLARQYGVDHRIARIRTWNFTESRGRLRPEDFGITQVVYPEENAMRAVMNFIETPNAIDAQDFHERSILLRSYQISELMPIAFQSLADLRGSAPGTMILVVAIIRGGDVFIPHGEMSILPEDKPLFIFPRTSLDHFLQLVGIESTAGRKAVVYGDTLTAVNITETLKHELDSVVLIDPDLEHGSAAAARLHGVDVLHGQGDDVDVLQEANIRFADFFIAAGQQTDENVLSCLLAKSEGAREVIAIVNDDKHVDLFHSIGINHIVNPRQLTASHILNVIHPGFMSSSLHIQKTDIEVLRLAVRDKMPIAGRTLREGWKKAIGEAIVGVVLREGETLIPSGETVLMPGDIVIVFSRLAGIEKVRKLFTVS